MSEPSTAEVSNPSAKDVTVKVEAGGPELKTPVGDAPVIPILMIAFGGYLMWFAVKYWRGSGPAVWPSYPIKSVLQGKGIPPNAQAQTASFQVASFEAQIPQPGQQGAGGSGVGQGPQPKGSYQNMAKLLLSRYGWGPEELPPLIALWTGESGWSPTAWNPSGAYGIAQALGHAGTGECATGPRTVGSSSPGLNCSYGAQYGLSKADAQAANSGHALPQIRWGLGYIKATYGTPSAAYAAWLSRSPHWY